MNRRPEHGNKKSRRAQAQESEIDPAYESASEKATSRTSQPGFNAPGFVKSGANVRSISDVSKYINALCAQIDNGRTISAHELLFEMALALGYPENELTANISWYFSFGENQLRISDHYGDPELFKLHNHPENNHGVVIKLSPAVFHKDPDVDYVEYVYFPDKITPTRQIAILRGLEHSLCLDTFLRCLYLISSIKVNSNLISKYQGKINLTSINLTSWISISTTG